MSSENEFINDPGVIGMSYFINRTNPQSPRSIVSNSSSPYSDNDQRKKSLGGELKKKAESEVFEYASNGEWGKLSEEERQLLIDEMKLLRAKTDSLVNRAGKGRKYGIMVAFVVAILLFGKSKGIISNKLFPSLSTVGIAAMAMILNAIYQIRAPPMANKPHPKSPYHYPILGVALSVIPEARTGVIALLLKGAKNSDFETTEVSFLGGGRSISVMDPIDRKYVLKDNWKNFLKNSNDPKIVSFMDLFAEVLGRGIFNTDKREWQDHRKVASSMFSVSGLRQQMEYVFKEHSKKLVQMLNKYAENNELIDIQNMFQSFTFDTICEIAFGISPNALDYAMRGEREPFLVSFDFAQVAIASRTYEPRPLWEFKRYFGIGNEGELVTHLSFIKSYVNNIISQRRNSNNNGNDLLSLYIQFARKTGQTYMEDDAYLRDIILNFMIAGRDTTACTLTNWFKLVGTSNRGNEIAKNIVNECDQVLKSKNADELTWESAQELTYSDAVFNESIRMYPPVGGDFRYAENDDVLPSSGFKVPAGTRVLISNYAIGRDPNLWKEPDTFVPERWIRYDKDGKTMLPVKRPDEYVFPVFWAGPRLCLGKDMARFEAKLLACSIFKSFRIEIQPHEENFVNGPVMFYVGKVNALVKKIN